MRQDDEPRGVTREGGWHQARKERKLYAALDLGTNNCRLLIAEPIGSGFRVIDAFSRIVRLGEGLQASGRLSDAAMERAIDALKICAEKLGKRQVVRVRGVATQACRAAENGQEFLDLVRSEVGLSLELISPQEEARLAVIGCMSLVDREADAALVVDIGGGSTELSWVDARDPGGAKRANVASPPIMAWTSMPIGVATLADRFAGAGDDPATYVAMRDYVRTELSRFAGADHLRDAFATGSVHLIGTSGTITSLAGMHLGLRKYQRSAVDGLWISMEDTRDATQRLRGLDRSERARQPCIGPDRADFVLPGCAILEAICEEWPSDRLRVADRGLREGLLVELMSKDGDRTSQTGRKRRRRGGRSRAVQS